MQTSNNTPLTLEQTIAYFLATELVATKIGKTVKLTIKDTQYSVEMERVGEKVEVLCSNTNLSLAAMIPASSSRYNKVQADLGLLWAKAISLLS